MDTVASNIVPGDLVVVRQGSLLAVTDVARGIGRSVRLSLDDGTISDLPFNHRLTITTVQ